MSIETAELTGVFPAGNSDCNGFVIDYTGVSPIDYFLSDSCSDSDDEAELMSAATRSQTKTSQPNMQIQPQHKTADSPVLDLPAKSKSTCVRKGQRP